MDDWRELLKTREIKQINGLHLSKDEAAEYLGELRKHAKRIQLEHGFEEAWRYALPNETSDPFQEEIATIFSLGELEAHVEGGPKTHLETWTAQRSELIIELEELASRNEPEEGSEELSRRHHAKEALGFLSVIEHELKIAVHGLTEKHDKRLLEDICAGVAHYAFIAGREYQIASGKEMEGHAVRGRKTLRSAELSGSIASRAASSRDLLRFLRHSACRVCGGSNFRERLAHW